MVSPSLGWLVKEGELRPPKGKGFLRGGRGKVVESPPSKSFIFFGGRKKRPSVDAIRHFDDRKVFS